MGFLPTPLFLFFFFKSLNFNIFAKLVISSIVIHKFWLLSVKQRCITYVKSNNFIDDNGWKDQVIKNVKI